MRLTTLYFFVLAFSTIGLISCNESGNKKETKDKPETGEIVDTTVGDTISEEIEEERPPLLSTHPLITWVRKTPVDIGCMFEKGLGHKDSKFNCDYGVYKNEGDPCNNTDAYYEGPVFPQNLSGKIDPTFKEVRFDFERGLLREVSITFKDSVLINDIKKKFALPDKFEDYPTNINYISYGENTYSKDKPVNPNYTRWLTITGFDHMGAGDVDCE